MEFVIRIHQADRAGLHYDFHLQMDPQTGVFESWAIRKGLPNKDVQHLAIRTQDHTTEGAFTSGTITGGYGKGTTSVTDSGEYVLLSRSPGRRKIRLLGNVYRGDYSLYHTPNYGKNTWLIRKV